MRPNTATPGGVLPRWLVAVGSVAIICHFVAVIIPILDVPSGPWPMPMPSGRAMAEPPHFAHMMSGISGLHGKYLRVAHSYHFVSNRPGDMPGVQFEVRLKDDKGEIIQTLAFPDPGANSWVRHRQELLASALAPDIPVQPLGGEVIAAPDGKVPTEYLWLLPGEVKDILGIEPPAQSGGQRKVELSLHAVDKNLIPRGGRPFMRPSEWAMVLSRSYARYLCRTHGAASAEIVRLSREPVAPGVLFGNPNVPPVETLVASFGEMPR
jgi:hypothetical protein